MGFWDSISSLMTGAELPRVDIRNPTQMALGNQLAQQYGQASANPNYGLPSPELQALQENELTRDVLGRTGSAGAGGSGFSRDQVRKGIVDFRINLIAQRQKNLDNLRSAAIMGSGPAMAPADQRTGILQQAARTGAGALTNDAFGISNNTQNTPQPSTQGQTGGAPGTPGFRNPNQQGGMSVAT